MKINGLVPRSAFFTEHSALPPAAPPTEADIERKPSWLALRLSRFFLKENDWFSRHPTATLAIVVGLLFFFSVVTF